MMNWAKLILKKVRSSSRLLLREILPFWVLRVLTDWWPDYTHCQRLRGFLFRPIFGSCGSELKMGSHVMVIQPSRVKLGRDVMLANGTWIDGLGGVEIGDEVLVAPYCVIVSSLHTFREHSASRGKLKLAPTRIGSGTWLAAHVVVSAGVTIGNGVLIGANSVVTRDVPDKMMAAGVPARIIGKVKEIETQTSAED